MLYSPIITRQTQDSRPNLTCVGCDDNNSMQYPRVFQQKLKKRLPVLFHRLFCSTLVVFDPSMHVGSCDRYRSDIRLYHEGSQEFNVFYLI